MRTLLTRGMWWLASAMTSLSACGDSPRCTPWEEVECSCENGRVGTRLCQSNGAFDECYCAGERSWHDGLDAGAADSSRLAFDEDVGFDAPAIDGQLLLAGAEKLLDVFVRDENVWVILENRVVRIALADGTDLASWGAPRQVSATAFDGERLAILEGARLTMLDPAELKPQRSLDLIEPCESAALMSGGGPLACSAGNKLHVIDPATGTQQSLSRGVYTGVLREVPGTRRFLTTDVSSTLYARIFELGADGGLTGWPALNPSAYRSSEELSGPAAFDGFPSQNLVTKSGLLLRVDGRCGPSTDTCLVRTGSLELFEPALRFVAMDTAGDQLFGLLDREPDPFSDRPRCYAEPCTLMRIGVNARELLAEQTVARPLGSVVALRALPEQGAVVLGITTALLGTVSPSIPGGFEVVRLDLPPQ